MISCDLQTVVASSDSSVLGMLPFMLQNMGVRPIIHRQAATVLETVSKQRVDAVFVDWDLDPDFSVLREIRSTPAGRKLVGMAVVSRQAPIRESFRFSDFVLEKPLIQQRVTQTLRAAHGMMVRDRLQYTRIPLKTDALVFDGNAKSFSAVATNVSQSGIALESSAKFLSGEMVQIQFRLPEGHKNLSCKAKVIWSDNRTKAGFSFLEMKVSDRETLSSWIENEFMEGWQRAALPGHPALIAGAAQAIS